VHCVQPLGLHSWRTRTKKITPEMPKKKAENAHQKCKKHTKNANKYKSGFSQVQPPILSKKDP
jgi:hypothetical protein